MAGAFTAVDLSRLASPPAIEVLDHEAIVSELIADFSARYPHFTAALASEPVVKLLECCAYREVLQRQRVNEGVRSVMLAYAVGADLDHLAAMFGVGRLTLSEAVPEDGIAAVMESDNDLRRRVQMALEGVSTAGPAGAYVFHALGAHASILDASVASPAPGEVVVSVLARNGEAPTPEALAAVEAAVNDDTVRPLTDFVTVVPAARIDYAVEAEIVTYSGPDTDVIMAEARARLDDYTAATGRLGRAVTLSGIYAALHAEGVQRVVLSQPVADIFAAPHEAPRCTAVSLTHGGSV